MFVLAVAASNLARDMILAPNVGPLQKNITAKFNSDTSASQNQPKPPKSLKQLVVVSNAADDLDGCVEPDLYRNHPAAFVPS